MVCDGSFQIFPQFLYKNRFLLLEIILGGVKRDKPSRSEASFLSLYSFERCCKTTSKRQNMSPVQERIIVIANDTIFLLSLDE